MRCLIIFYKCLQVCKIVEGQRYSKRLNERQITNLLRVTCQRPQDREMDIIQVVSHCIIYSISAHGITWSFANSDLQLSFIKVVASIFPLFFVYSLKLEIGVGALWQTIKVSISCIVTTIENSVYFLF